MTVSRPFAKSSADAELDEIEKELLRAREIMLLIDVEGSSESFAMRSFSSVREVDAHKDMYRAAMTQSRVRFDALVKRYVAWHDARDARGACEEESP